MDVTKLRVTDLRSELSSRGLDQKGVKAVLVERLKQALEKESQDVENASDDNSAEGNEEEVNQDNNSPNKEDAAEIQGKQDEDEIEPEHKSEEEPVSELMDVEIKQEVEEPEDPPDNYFEEKPVVKQEVLDSDLVDKDHHNDPFKKDHYEVEIKQEPQVKEEKTTEENSNNYSNERKRKHSRSRSRSPSPANQERQKFTKVWKDYEPEIDDNVIQLSWYDSDLNLVIDQSKFLTASPMSELGFGYVWAGVRANHGFSSGKVCFEVKLLENNDVSHLEDEPSPHVLRVGWSILSSGMLLGEEPFSYGYGGTGKASTNCNFINYGKPYVAGDVVTAYLDYGPEQVVMSFSVNGEWQDVAYKLPYATFDGQALYPHLLSKNIKFEVNFGQNDPWFKTLPEYVWGAHVPNNQRVPGPRRPEKREDCEMLMMCGLPGCGKTVWANEWASNYPEKFYNILGSNNLIDKMKIQGLPRKRNYHGRWDILIEKCMKCLNKLLEMAHKRRRNYILDQTNVFPTAQKRKMRSFGGFVRRAIVIVPTDEEFKRRVAKREAEEGKDVPDSAVMEMKAHFKLPEKGEYFDEVIYTELPEEEARPLVEQYNKEARDAGYGQQKGFSNPGGRGNKRFRPNERQPRGGSGGSYFGGNNRGDNRDFKTGMDHQGDRNRGGWQPRGDRSGWSDRKPAGGFRPGGRDDHHRDHGFHGTAGGNRGDYGRDNFRGRDNYGAGRDNYGGGRDNFRGGRGNFGSGRGNFGGGRGNYGGGRGNSGSGRDNSGGGRDNSRGDRSNLGGGRDNFRGGRDNFGGGRDNFGGNRDNYERGRDDRSRGGFDRNRRDGPPNRNLRDNKSQGGSTQVAPNSGLGKQGGSNWPNQGYQQGWDQNQRSSWGQNYQQGWKGPQEAQQQNYNTQFQQYGGQQYGMQNQGWNQAPGGVFGYGQQGMNPLGYGYGGAPPNQGK